MRQLCLALAVASCLSSALVEAQDQAFQFESDLRLLSVDLTTGSAVSTINARLGGLQHCRALTWNDEAQQLWVAEFDATNARIGILDPATAAFTPRRLTGVAGSWVAMSWDHTSAGTPDLHRSAAGDRCAASCDPSSSPPRSRRRQ